MVQSGQGLSEARGFAGARKLRSALDVASGRGDGAEAGER